MRWPIVALVLLLPLAPQAVFDAASIRSNRSGDARWVYDVEPGGRFVAQRVSLLNLIAIAYGSPYPMPANRITGGPDWIRSERFDVIAKAAGDLRREQFPDLLRALIAERFKLQLHRASVSRQVLVLRRARDDGRLGSQLRPTDLDCSAAADTNTHCGDRNYPGQLRSPSLTMPVLARLLMLWTEGREVRDGTGLTGSFAATLDWTPDRVPPQPLDAPAEIGSAIAAIDPGGPTLITALRDQLGLTLEPRTEAVEVLVIDRAERPAVD